MSLGFMGSQQHRDNILSPGFTSAGIGVYCAPNHSLWVTIEFARRMTQGTPPPYGGKTKPTPIARKDVGRVVC